MKQKDFAQILGINPNTLRAYEDGRSIPNQDVLERICVKFSVSPAWLLLGRGPMYEKGNKDDTSTPPSTKWPPLIPILMKSKIIGSLIHLESSGDKMPMKVFVDKILQFYMEEYEDYINGNKELPNEEASIQVIESLRPKNKLF